MYYRYFAFQAQYDRAVYLLFVKYFTLVVYSEQSEESDACKL